MKKFISYIIVCATMLMGSCAKDTQIEQGEGAISFRIAVAGSETRAYDPTANLLIRIYNQDGGLIRRYASLDAMPSNLFLVAGDYKITVDAGDNSTATWTNKTYHGEKAFTVLANRSTTETVSCPSVNVGAQVTFDATINSKFDKGAHVYVSANNQFLLTEINDVPTLKYDPSLETAVGYFILPEGTTNLSWGFDGEGTDLGKVSSTGVIENVESAMIYKLKFQYSKTPDGAVKINVFVDKTAEEHFDNIIFSPQPSIKGDGFPMVETIGFNNNEIAFNVTSVKNLTKVVMKYNNAPYTVFDTNGATTLPTGVITETINDKSLKLKLTPEFFAQFATGIHKLDFQMLDTDNGEGKGTTNFAIPGVMDAEVDIWTRTTNLKAIVTDPAATEVKFEYRTKDGTWAEVVAKSQEKCIYTAVVTPRWSASKNEKEKDVYTIDTATGLLPGITYEYRTTFGEVSSAVKEFTTADANVIPSLNQTGLSCYTQSNSNAPFWGSGNNGTTDGLCSYDSSVLGAKMSAISNTATNIVGMFAPGNLFSGSFTQSGMNGAVSFGNKYAFSAQPTALTLKYKASIGNVDVIKHGGSPLSKGDPDKARIFVAIVNWESQHKVTSGVGAPSGMWNPADGVNAVSEGTIIGYSMIDIKGTTAELTELTLPIHYFDKNAKPTEGNYSLVISCATSAYGDYIAGCKSNTISVADFKWIY